MNLADAIAAAHEQNERALAAQVAPYQMDNDSRQSVSAFARFCADNGVRSLPATPATVALFVQSIGARTEEVAQALLAIQEAHDQRGLPSPIATAAVRSALSRIFKIKPPRSWRKAEQLIFAELPPEIRAAVERREAQRDTELRRLQTEVAKLRHGGAKSAHIEKELPNEAQA